MKGLAKYTFLIFAKVSAPDLEGKD